ncbi:unnamed protein product [Pieris brassicae]|uniref:Uncharacterized protein n=1 Tax=Pieris brassicae TaxID=7116 RepID=A0A9P0TVY0_PIEBR|nr:unnamed protein product [Pieris brassicae]
MFNKQVEISNVTERGSEALETRGAGHVRAPVGTHGASGPRGDPRRFGPPLSAPNKQVYLAYHYDYSNETSVRAAANLSGWNKRVGRGRRRARPRGGRRTGRSAPGAGFDTRAWARPRRACRRLVINKSFQNML